MAQRIRNSSQVRLLQLLAALLVVLVVTLLVVYLRIVRQEALLDYLNHLEATHQELVAIEFGFLFEKQRSYLQRLGALRQAYDSTTASQFNAETARIARNLSRGDAASELVDSIRQSLEAYFAEVSQIIALQSELGLNHEAGHYGALREHAHALEDRLLDLSDDSGLVQLLQLRRHEKDFMLRGEDIYITRFNEAKRDMLLRLGARYAGQTQQRELLVLMDRYTREFLDFVGVSNALGYGETSGATQRTAAYRSRHQSMSLDAHSLVLRQSAPMQLTLRVLVALLVVALSAMAAFLIRARRAVEHARERSPLTDLNGNRRIQMHLDRISRLRTNRVIVYFDFDFFKPFNDHFGFKLGDDAIRGFADLLRQEFGPIHSFIGHIGGDDFLVVMDDIAFPVAMMRARSVQERFRSFAEQFYEQEDIARGWAPRKDRFGELREVPLLSASIMVVELPPHMKVQNTDEISSAVSLVKGTAKNDGEAAITMLPWREAQL